MGRTPAEADVWEASLYAAPLAIVVVDPDARITWANRCFQEWLKARTSQFLGRHLSSLLPDSGVPSILHNNDGLVHRKERVCFPDRITLETAVLLARQAACCGAVGFYEDLHEVTVLSTAYTSVLERLRLLECVVRCLPFGTLATDAQDRVLWANPTIMNWVNCSHGDVWGQPLAKLIPPLAPPGIKSTVDGTTSLGIHQIGQEQAHVLAVPVQSPPVDMIYIAIAAGLGATQTGFLVGMPVREDQRTRPCRLADIVGVSKTMARLRERISRLADSQSTVLILGESGVGKELVARALHYESSRKEGPFVAINCASIPTELAESELFGFCEGAFTGSRRGGFPGRMALADGGTLFLDEVTSLPLPVQAKLLRAIEDREIFRLGDGRGRKIDVRLVAATNADPQQKVRVGEFRADLYYRLAVITLRIPPLRERLEDIPPLVNHIIGNLNRRFGRQITGLSSDALALLLRYHWPGNVRELENALEQAFDLCTGSVLDASCFPDLALAPDAATSEGLLKELIDSAEKRAIVEALLLCNGDKVAAAHRLGISRASLYSKMARHGIIVPLRGHSD
ncbi:MAG TPA: sigma 54-interacting transcriptional regulator [Firmicutes bacterium]|nr:sigma 54-interacting transcriptional regulator [Bacillota bacterium]